MATIPKPIQEVVNEYIKKISSQIPIQKVLLFGSYATGTYKKDSDVDIAFFSDYFKNMERLEAFRFLFTQAMEYDIDIQPQSFTTEDLNTPDGIVKEIIKSGIELPLQ